MSLEANQIATKGDLEDLFSRMQQLLTQAAPVAVANDEYLTLEEVAAATRFSMKTVKKWINEGKYDRKGKQITLLAVEFSPGYPRVPRSALLAFAQSMAFTISDLSPVPTMRVA